MATVWFAPALRCLVGRPELGSAWTVRVALVTGWLAQLGPVATGLVALVALVVGTLTVLQRSRADRRDQWWKRAQWAIDLTFAGHAERQKLAFRVLGVLGESRLAGAE